MYKQRLICQDAKLGKTSLVRNELVSLANGIKPNRLRIAVAYASAQGVNEFSTAIATRLSNFNSIPKEWLISIDFGHTEPEALRKLNRLPNSAVRIPNGASVLAAKLMPHACFHPKTFMFERLDKSKNWTAVGTLIGSANLTMSALHTNVEHCLSSLDVSEAKERKLRHPAAISTFSEWWADAWNLATTINPDWIDAYERIRKKCQPKVVDADPEIEPYLSGVPLELSTADGLRWATAKCFWIETLVLYKNRGPKEAGNQLDTRRGTRVYFGFSPLTVPKNTIFGDIVVQYEGMEPSVRSVRFGNNLMDKINLPVPGDYGPDDYDNTILHFERIGPHRFHLTTGDEVACRRWIKHSQNQKMIYRLSPKRRFGFYS